MTKLVLKTGAAEEMRILSVSEIAHVSGAKKAERLKDEAEGLADEANDAGKFSKAG